MVSITPAVTGKDPGVSMHKRQFCLIKEIWKHRVFYIFLIPAVVVILIFAYRPYAWLVMAFQDFRFEKGLLGSNFVGLENFRAIIQDTNFTRILRNTLVMNCIGLVLGFPAPIIFALLVNEIRGRHFKKTAQTITYLPHFISWVIVAGMFYNILNEETGIINILRTALGADRIAYLREPQYFWGIIILISIWKEVGWNSIIYLAALTSIDQEQYSAATVDGATKLQQILHVTLPGLSTTISIMLILSAGTIVTGGGIVPGFEAIYNMSNPMLSSTAETIQIYNYNQGVLYNRYSYAAALDLAQSAISFILVFAANSLAKRIKGYSVY